jgi:hypothetical protein
MLTPEWRKSSYSNGQSSCVEVKGVWRKSSYSNNSSNCVEVKGIWRMSTHSNGQANCVEVNLAPDAVAIRDSKNPIGAVLSVTPAAWSGFTTTIKQGNLGL